MRCSKSGSNSSSSSSLSILFGVLIILIGLSLLLSSVVSSADDGSATCEADTAAAATAPEEKRARSIDDVDNGSTLLDVRAEALALGLPEEFWNGTDPTELRRALEFGKLTRVIAEAYEGPKRDAGASSSAPPTRRERERSAIAAALEALNMSNVSSWLFDDGGRDENQSNAAVVQLLKENWLYEFYQRFTSLAPSNCIFNVYTDRPSDAQLRLVAAVDHRARELAINVPSSGASASSFHDRTFREEAFDPFRHRGGVAHVKHELKFKLLEALQELSSFAVPSPKAGETIKQHITSGKLIEMGAGTGYWSGWLEQTYGLDVLAYDFHPPKENGTNEYFTTNIKYADVKGGSCVDVLKKNPELASTRALLLVWPNNPDNVDQAEHFYSKDLEKVPAWDAACLRAYMEANGAAVVYVGEREERVHIMPGAPVESGLTATREFQQLLKDNFDLVGQADDLPSFWTYDDLTVWMKKKQQ